jgi:hypothetical protein
VPDLAARYRYALAHLLRGTGLSPDDDHELVRAWQTPSDEATRAFASPASVDAGSLVTHGPDSAPVPFRYADGLPDLVGSAFWWLAGLDELRAPARDDHGRPLSSDSLLVRSGWAERPLVDAYRALLIADARAAGLEVEVPAGWMLCPTHDIDAMRKWRPGILWRELGERALLNRLGEPPRRRLGRIAHALRGVLGPDPYARAPARLAQASERRGGRATLFFKAAARSPYDVGYRVPRALMGALRQSGHEIGLHPSYATFDDASMLGREACALGLEPPLTHRAHYLRYDVLRSPGILAAAGVGADSTLGWADRAGFRRGTARPFRLYDLLADRPADVVEVPLVLMDGAVFVRMGLGASDARALTRRLLGEIAGAGGAAAMLWHHHTYDAADAPGWSHHFETTLDSAVRQGARLATVGEAAREVQA